MTSTDPDHHLLEHLLAGRDDAPVLIEGERAITRVQLRAAAAEAAAGLAALGFKRGDALAVWLPNGASWLQLLFAAARLGLLIVPISTRYKSQEVRHLLEVSRARGIVAARRFLDLDHAAIARQLQSEVPTLACVLEQEDLESFLPFPSPREAQTSSARGDDLLCCFSTSGTTGFPKLAAHGHASIARHALHVARVLEIRPGDAMLCVLPLFGVFGFMTAMAAIAGGASCVLMPVFDAGEAAGLIGKHRISHAVGADSMFDAMLKVEGADFRSWRHAVQGDFVGIPLQVTQAGDVLGVRFTNTYGSSECYSLMSFQRWDAPAEQRAKAGGTPVDPGISVRVVDPESGRELGAGEAGEIQIRGPNVLAQYLNNPEATSKAITSDGWFMTGDLGACEEHGFVYLARMGDSLRLRGYLVNPFEIESCLMAHPSVGGAQVVGVRIPGEGDIAVAYVIAGEDAPEESVLLAHCRECMASYKVPRRVITIDEFPAINGPNGNKIQKRQLREMAKAVIG